MLIKRDSRWFNSIIETVLVNGLPPTYQPKEGSTSKWTKSTNPDILSRERLFESLSQSFGESSGVNTF
jgi:hypothetical protein